MLLKCPSCCNTHAMYQRWWSVQITAVAFFLSWPSNNGYLAPVQGPHISYQHRQERVVPGVWPIETHFQGPAQLIKSWLDVRWSRWGSVHSAVNLAITKWEGHQTLGIFSLNLFYDLAVQYALRLAINNKNVMYFRTGAGEAADSGPSGVRWQYFSEAAYIAGDRLGSGEDKYARNKFNQVSV